MFLASNDKNESVLKSSEADKMVMPEHITPLRKVATALFYACSSILIVIVNKVVLTTYK